MACNATWHAVLFVTIFVAFPAGTSPKMSAQSSLLKTLLEDYGPSTIRPVYNITHKTTVVHRLLITQVIELNEKHQTIQISGWLRQTWNDEFLTWDPAEHSGVDRLFVHKSQIWLPDITLYKNVDKDFESYKDISCTVRSNGDVSWATPVILKCTCLIDARLFPFDTQVCQLKFSSWAFDGSEVDLVREEGAAASQDHFADNGVWELLLVQVVREEQWYNCCPAPYPEVTYFLHLRRRPLFHVLNIMLPCVLLSILNLMVFCLPPESGEKVQLGMTNLLALVLFQQLISESLPPTSDKSPIIGFYFTPMIAIGCSSIMCTVLVLSLFYHDNTRSVPRWLRWVVLRLAVVVCYRVRREPLDTGTTVRNPNFRLNGEVRSPPCTEPDSGVLTATCSFTDSSRSVNAEEDLYAAGEAGDDRATSHGQQPNGRTRCRAYSMHIMQKTLYSNGAASEQQPGLAAVAESLSKQTRLPALGGKPIVEWRDAALILDRATMILSVIVTGVAMLISIIFFAIEM